MPRRYTIIIWRLIVAGAFISAGVAKGVQGFVPNQPTLFSAWVASSAAVHYLAVATELLLGLWMLSGLTPRWSAGVTLLVLVGFSVLIGWEMTRADPRACGCWSQVLPGTADIATLRRQLMMGLIRNLILVGACVYLYLTAVRGGGAQGAMRVQA